MDDEGMDEWVEGWMDEWREMISGWMGGCCMDSGRVGDG